MENLKFRAWLKEEKKMVVPSSINWNRGYVGALVIFVDNPIFDPVKHILEDKESEVQPFFTYTNHTLESHLKVWPHEFELQQFTGLKDKRGKEGWSGDLRELNGKLYKLVNDGWRFRFTRNMVEFGENEDIVLDEDNLYESVLKGNIHENLELLTTNRK